MRILDLEQGTPEWLEARRCKISGTKLDEVMGTAYERTKLLSRLIAEEGTEQTKMVVATPEMERGSAEEVFAVKRFEQRTGKVVKRDGLCVSDEFDWLVLSPDGLIANERGEYTEAVEVKSPNSETAVFYRLCNLVGGKELGLTAAKQPFVGVPAEYKWQVVQYFLVNEKLQKLYFLVYDARFIDDDMKLMVVEVERHNELLQDALAEAREELAKFRTDWIAYKGMVLPDNF